VTQDTKTKHVTYVRLVTNIQVTNIFVWIKYITYRWCVLIKHVTNHMCQVMGIIPSHFPMRIGTWTVALVDKWWLCCVRTSWVMDPNLSSLFPIRSEVGISSRSLASSLMSQWDVGADASGFSVLTWWWQKLHALSVMHTHEPKTNVASFSSATWSWMLPLCSPGDLRWTLLPGALVVDVLPPSSSRDTPRWLICR